MMSALPVSRKRLQASPMRTPRPTAPRTLSLSSPRIVDVRMQQRRRVQQGVERDLAPLRRLGAFAGSSGGGGGRGSGGCADSSEMREFEPRSRVAGDGDRTRGVNGVTCGNGGDVAEDDGQDGAGGPKPGGGAWNGEITGHR